MLQSFMCFIWDFLEGLKTRTMKKVYVSAIFSWISATVVGLRESFGRNAVLDLCFWLGLHLLEVCQQGPTIKNHKPQLNVYSILKISSHFSSVRTIFSTGHMVLWAWNFRPLTRFVYHTFYIYGWRLIASIFSLKDLEVRCICESLPLFDFQYWLHLLLRLCAHMNHVTVLENSCLLNL